MKCKIKIKNGFTLLEIIVSMVMLVSLAVGMMNITSFLKAASERGAERMVAMQALEKKIAEYKAMSPGDIKALADPIADVDLPQLRNLSGVAKIQTKVVQMENDAGLKQINLKVDWNDMNGKPQSQYLSSVIYVE